MSGQSIEISVIIPVYNAGDHIEDCVASVKASADSFMGSECGAGKSVQIVLVDDGSTDNSPSICDALSIEGVTVRHTANFGVSHARNIGMELAEGRYIAFVDADDSVSSDYLTDLYTALEDSKAIVSDMMGSLEDGRIYKGYDFISDAVLFYDTHVWGKLFCAEAIKTSKVRFREDLTIGEDMLFLSELAAKSADNSFAVKASPDGYRYTDNAGGAMKKAFSPSYIDQIRCWKLEEELMKGAGHTFGKESYDRLSEIQMMSAMLVAGKIACMDDNALRTEDADLVRAALDNCLDTIISAKKLGKGFKRLSFSYRLKVLLFKANRRLYLKIYGRLKG